MSTTPNSKQQYDPLPPDYEHLDPSNPKFKSLNFDLCFSYLAQIRDPVTIISDNRAQVAIGFIRQYLHKLDFSFIVDYYPVAIRVFVNILNTYKNDIKGYISNTHLFKNQNDVEGIEKIYVIQCTILLSLVSIIWNSTNANVTFRKLFHEYGGTKAILSYLDDDQFIDSCKLYKNLNAKDPNQPGESILRAMIGSINNLSKDADDLQIELKELEATRILMKLYEKVSNLTSHRLSCCMALANILRDNEIESLPNSSNVIHELVGLIQKASERIALKQDKYRRSIEIGDKIGNKEQIICVTLNNTSYHIVELIQALYKIAINDNSKLIIYDKLQEIICLNSIILVGNKIESEYGLKLLLQLCFNKSVLKKLTENKDLFDFITITLQQENKDSIIYKYCDGILWLNKTNNENLIQNSDLNVEIKHENHIMISYNRETRDLCLKVKKFLESLNFKVWIDVENIHGSSLQSMAYAIESSKCVLMCMTEKYKQSSYCRAEAEYAFRLGVPIVPLIMQKNYQPDGWLGIILGSKIFVDFTKYSFDECTQRLMKEINNLAKQLPEFNKIEVKQVNSQVETSKSDNAILWSNEQIIKWLNKNSFDVKIMSTFDTYDGKMLNKLNQMQKTAPEFYYSSLLKQFGNDLGLLIKFSVALDELF